MEHEVQPLSIDGLSVGYGSRQVLNNLRLQIAKGEIFGLLGPNGAGKTTLIRTICGRLKPQAGAVAVGGSRGKDRVRRLGLAPQELALYSHLTIRENLEVFGCLSGIRRRDLCERLDWASKASQVAERLDERVEHLSGGWKRRVNITAAILHLPALLILDEPTAGVDIEARSQTAITVERMAGGFTIDQKVRLDASLRAVAEKDARVVDSTPPCNHRGVGGPKGEHSHDCLLCRSGIDTFPALFIASGSGNAHRGASCRHS